MERLHERKAISDEKKRVLIENMSILEQRSKKYDASKISI